MMVDADVIIVGGGIMGSSVAWQLSKTGMSVLVIERNDIASGSAGATDGVVGYHTKQPGPQMELAVQSIAMFHSLQEELDDPTNFDFSAGGLQPAENEMEFQLLSEIASKQRESGVDVRMISAEEACALEPHLARDIQGALYCPTSGKVNPLKLTFAYANAARKNGVRYLYNTEVIGFILNDRQVAGVRTYEGDYYANTVVNAAGSWAGKVASLAGLDMPIKPRKGQLAVTEPVDFFMRATVQCARYDIIKFWPDRVKDQRALRLGSSLSIEQMEEGSIVIGCTRELVGFQKHNTFEAVDVMMKRAIRFFPDLENVDVIRFFSGFRPYTPDGRPLLGEVNGIKGFYMAAGHEGDGIALSAITGKVISDLIVEGQTSCDIKAFDPNRFSKS